MEYSLKDLYDRFDWAVGNLTVQQLKDLDSEAYQQLLLEKANCLFAEGRFNPRTEHCLGVFEDEKGVHTLHDLKQISALTEGQRVKLHFFQDLKALCYPLYRRQAINLTQAPFHFTCTEFSIMNSQLRSFLYETEYRHVALMLCDALINHYWEDEELLDTVVKNTLSEQLFYSQVSKLKDTDKQREELDKIIDAIFTAENHLRVGKLLGLSPQAQAIYDMTDTFICQEYLYNQVEFAQELDQWIDNCWMEGTPERRETSIRLLLEELDACAQKHEVSFVDKSSTINQLLYDLMGVPLFSEREDQDDDSWDE